MAGHSKWANIRHRKGTQDSKRGKIFTKIIKEITVSARLGGGDQDSNPRLRKAVSNARSNNMPQDNIIRAIKKGTGELEGVKYEEMSYEGYGPNGIAIYIETITDNKNRTVAEIRHVLSKAGGSLGQSGSVAWNFDRMGVILIEESAIEEDRIFNISIENDAKDFKLEDGYYKLFFDHNILYQKIEIIEKKSVEVDSSFIAFVPKDFIKVSQKDGEGVEKLIDMLEDLEDVQNVYSNYEIVQSS